jgi:hypothetical protein
MDLLRYVAAGCGDETNKAESSISMHDRWLVVPMQILLAKVVALSPSSTLSRQEQAAQTCSGAT